MFFFLTPVICPQDPDRPSQLSPTSSSLSGIISIIWELKTVCLSGEEYSVMFSLPPWSFYSLIWCWFRNFSLNSETSIFSLCILSFDSSVLMLEYLNDCCLDGGILSLGKENMSALNKSWLRRVGEWHGGLFGGQRCELFRLFTDSIIFTSIARGILILSTNDGENIALEFVSPWCNCSIYPRG